MEQYSKITRFCIICNYHHKIIEPIISRCSLFRFKPINNEDIVNKLINICYKENINYTQDMLNKIINLSRGDLRKAINLLQKCYNIYGNSFNNELLEEISGIISTDKFNLLMENIFNKNMTFVDSYIKQLYYDGYSLVNQILLFHDYIVQSNLSSITKAKICYKIVEIDQNLIKGSDEFIQFMNLSYYIMSII